MHNSTDIFLTDVVLFIIVNFVVVVLLKYGYIAKKFVIFDLLPRGCLIKSITTYLELLACVTFLLLSFAIFCESRIFTIIILGPGNIKSKYFCEKNIKQTPPK